MIDTIREVNAGVACNRGADSHRKNSPDFFRAVSVLSNAGCFRTSLRLLRRRPELHQGVVPSLC